MLADTLLIVGFVGLMAGLCGAFGWPWAAMTGGSLLCVAGGLLLARAPKETAA